MKVKFCKNAFSVSKIKDSKLTETNLLILDYLIHAIKTYPDCRFGQLLSNLDIIVTSDDYGLASVKDPFYDTNEAILARVKAAVDKF